MMLQTLHNVMVFFAAALVCGKYAVMASIALMNCVAGLYGKLPVKLDSFFFFLCKTSLISSSDRLLANLLTVVLFLSLNVTERNIHCFMMMLYNYSVKSSFWKYFIDNLDKCSTSPYQ